MGMMSNMDMLMMLLLVPLLMVLLEDLELLPLGHLCLPPSLQLLHL